MRDAIVSDCKYIIITVRNNDSPVTTAIKQEKKRRNNE